MRSNSSPRFPHSGTGKVSKKDLREQFRDYKLVEA